MMNVFAVLEAKMKSIELQVEEGKRQNAGELLISLLKSQNVILW